MVRCDGRVRSTLIQVVSRTNHYLTTFSWVHQTSSTIKDFVVGAYVKNDPAGLRSHPYSTNNDTNPLTYSSVATRNEVHDIGEIWANILHNLLAALVGAHGFTADARINPS